MPQIQSNLITVYTQHFSENSSRVCDTWGTREVHILTRTISTCLCGRSQRTIIKSNHPQHGRSPRAQLILNLMSMYVHDIISTEQGMMIHLNKTNIGMAYNHIYYLTYMCSNKKHYHTKR